MVSTYVLMMSMVFFLFASCGKQSNQKLAQTYFKMGFLELSDQGQGGHAYQKALAYVNQALEYDQKPEYQALKATILFNLGDFAQSDQCFARARELQPDASLLGDITNNQACLYAQNGEREKAKKLWEGLVRDTSYQTPEVALVNLGKMYAKDKNFAQAKGFFDKAVSVAPSFVDAHLYRAIAARYEGDVATAREAVKTVLLLEPEHQLAQQLGKSIDL